MDGDIRVDRQPIGSPVIIRAQIDLEVCPSHLMPSDCPRIGGYLFYMTSVESADYWRPYIDMGELRLTVSNVL